jgi:hypothetical protein
VKKIEGGEIMKFPEKTLRLLEVREIKTKNDSIMYIASMADKDTYENAEFVLSRNQDTVSLVKGHDYNVVLDWGRYSSIELTPAKKAA